MRVTLDFPAAEEILQEVGLDEQGDTQMFHTKNVLRRIQKYMPYRTGATIKLTVAQTDPRVPEIVTEEPQVVYLYNGVSRSGKPLNYAYTEGQSFKEIAEYLTTSGTAYHFSDNSWNKNIVARILANEIYCGAKGYPAIISKEVYSQAASIRSNKTVTYSAVLKPFRSDMQCACCGERLSSAKSSYTSIHISTSNCETDRHYNKEEHHEQRKNHRNSSH